MARNQEIGARGEARGEGRAVLTVLETRDRGTDAIRDRILASTDLDLLETWLRRAVTATTAEEILAG